MAVTFSLGLTHVFSWYRDSDLIAATNCVASQFRPIFYSHGEGIYTFFVYN